jgi:proteasome lid subunit RPN8/RPN11
MAKPQTSQLGDQYQTYPTPSAAAVAALRGIKAKQVETGGGILYNKEQNAYAATEPVGQSDGTQFAAAVAVPQGWQLHSTYHTHPSGDRSTQFSNGDITTAQRLKAPSYVLAFDDNKIRMFDPASSKVLKDTSGDPFSSDSRFSNGSLVNETPLTAAPKPQMLAAAPAPPTPAPAPPAPVLVAGNRITMKDFAVRHRAARYKHKIVHIK